MALSPAVGSAAAEVKEVPLESATNGVAIGPDGAAYVASSGNSSLVRIDAAGTKPLPRLLSVRLTSAASR